MLFRSDPSKVTGATLAYLAISGGLEGAIAIWENYPDALKLMYNLRMKYMWDVYPFLSNRKPLQIAWIDSYDIFFDNITRQQSSYYSDGIHYTREGLLARGRAMATAMVQFGWYTAGKGYKTPGQPKVYTDFEVNKFHMYTTFKAMENNVPWNILLDRELQFQETGFAKDFPENGTTIYIIKDENVAYTLSGIIRTKYKEIGEGKSALGFPISDPYEIHYNTIIKADFECGTIEHNKLDLLNPVYVTVNSNKCKL